MNILIVTPYFPPLTGGVATYVDLCGRLLRRRGHQVSVIVLGASHLITPRNNDNFPRVYDFYLRPPWVPAAPIRGFIAFLVYFVPTLLKLAWFLKKQDIELIMIEYPVPDMYYFYVLKPLMKLKLIVGIHGDDILSLHLLLRYERWLVKRMARGANWLLAHSSSLMSQAERLVGHLNGNRSYLPCGIETNELRALAKKDIAQFAVPMRPYVLTVAKLYERKGLDVLLHAVEKISETVSGYRFVIVGDGPEELALKTLAVQLGIGDIVIFVGELQKEQIAKLYHHSEFFVLPSRSEPFGIVLLEAMAFGKAVIGTKVGGIPEFVTDGLNGILVPPNDPAILAESIILLINNPELRSKIAKNGFDLVERQYDFRVIVGRYVELFQKIVDAERRLS